MVLNAKFWSFPIHTYQKQPFLMIILAVRGRRKNLVIDRNSIVKNENLKILTKTHVIYLKRKLRTFRIQIQAEKLWFFAKMFKIIIFLDFSQCLNGPKKFFFRFFKIFKIFFEKRPQGDLGNVKRNKVIKYELFWSIHQGFKRDHLSRGVHWTPPSVE